MAVAVKGQHRCLVAKKLLDHLHVGPCADGDRLVDLEGYKVKLTMWNHDPDRLRDAVHYRGRGVGKPRFHVLAVPGPSGYLFNLASLDF
jgi:hypothetical protein